VDTCFPGKPDPAKRTKDSGQARWRRVYRVVTPILATLICACESDPHIGGRSIGVWIANLSDSNTAIRVDAAKALGSVLAVNPRSTRSAQALIKALADSVDAVRLAAGIALASEAVETPGIAAGLAAMLRDSAHAIVRLQAANLLGLVRVDVAVAEEALSFALNDPQHDVRVAAIQSLGELGSASQTTIARLAALYDDSLSTTRGLVVHALRHVEASTEEAHVVLLRALNDSDYRVRAAAATTIAALGERAALFVPALIQALGDREPSVRHAAIVAVGQFSNDARTALSKLDELARLDSVGHVREAAVYTAAVVRGERPPLKLPVEPTLSERCAGANRSRPGCG
jgi:HEAT repeat protein